MAKTTKKLSSSVCSSQSSKDEQSSASTKAHAFNSVSGGRKSSQSSKYATAEKESTMKITPAKNATSQISVRTATKPSTSCLSQTAQKPMSLMNYSSNQSHQRIASVGLKYDKFKLTSHLQGFHDFEDIVEEVPEKECPRPMTLTFGHVPKCSTESQTKALSIVKGYA